MVTIQTPTAKMLEHLESFSAFIKRKVNQELEKGETENDLGMRTLHMSNCLCWLDATIAKAKIERLNK